MGTVTAKTIIDKAAIQLIDLTNIRWTRAELLSWLNDGMRQIVLIQPSASTTTVSKLLVAGTRQTLPVDGWLLLSVYRNMGTYLERTLYHVSFVEYYYLLYVYDIRSFALLSRPCLF